MAYINIETLFNNLEADYFGITLFVVILGIAVYGKNYKSFEGGLQSVPLFLGSLMIFFGIYFLRDLLGESGSVIAAIVAVSMYALSLLLMGVGK